MTGEERTEAATRTRTKRPVNAYEALRERGWHNEPNSVRFCRWNSVRLFSPEGGGAILDSVRTKGGGRWIVQFEADVPLRVIVAAAEAAAGRPADA